MDHNFGFKEQCKIEILILKSKSKGKIVIQNYKQTCNKNLQTKFAMENYNANYNQTCNEKLQWKIASQNCKSALHSKILIQNCNEKLQWKIAMQHCNTTLQIKIANKNCTQKS